jgi:Zn-dependent M28 family amino/carboxypeptidase
MNVVRSLSASAILALTVVSASAKPAADPRIAAMVKAVSAWDVRAYDMRLVNFYTRNDFSDDMNSPTRGVFAARDWIKAQFEAAAAKSGGRMTVALDTYLQDKTPRTPRALTESSVIATLRGDEPGPTYVMSSHYDDCDGDCTDGRGLAPGADDNGSGASAVLEAAKVMASQHFHGTIIFAVFDGEELNLWGSDHFARELKGAQTNVVADLNNDIIGTSNAPAASPDRHTVRVFSQSVSDDAKVSAVNAAGSENDSPSREIARFVKNVSEQYVAPMTATLIYRADRFRRGGDQESFTAQGFPAIRFVEIHENFQHQHQNVRVENGVQYGDLPQYNDWNYLANVTRMNVAALAALALGPDQPGTVQIMIDRLANDSTLRWKSAARAASYEIVWRDTTAPLWQHSKNVGNVTQATVPVSKDNYILGVRSVDAAGLLSPAVYPAAVRQ